MTTETKFDLQEEIESTAIGFRLDLNRVTEIKELLEKTAEDSPATLEALALVLREQAPLASCFGFTYEDVLAEIAILFKQGVEPYWANVTIRTLCHGINGHGIGIGKCYFPVETVSDGLVRPLNEIMRGLRATHARMTDRQQQTVWAAVFGNEPVSKGYFSLLLGYKETEAKPAQMSQEDLQAIEKKIHEATILYLETVAELVKDCGEDDMLDFFPMYGDSSYAGVELTCAVPMRDAIKKQLTATIEDTKHRLTLY